MYVKNVKKLLIFVGLIPGIFVIGSGCGNNKISEENPGGVINEHSDADSIANIDSSADEMSSDDGGGIEFPYELEDGNIVVNTVFQSSIENPDNNWEYGDDIATVEFVNNSGEYIEQVAFTVTLSDERQINFKAEDIPYGATVWAFATGNETMGQQEACLEVNTSVEYGISSVKEESIGYSVNETEITLQNLTGDSIQNLLVGCHCLFDGVYFGGICYHYPVEYISAGEMVSIEASDCFLGSAEVVEICDL